MINVLDPARFWDDAVEAKPGHMPEEHKGGVVFGYRTPNPWHGRESQTIPNPDDSESMHTVACSIPCSAPPNPDTHIPWFTVAPCSKSRGVDKGEADRDYSLGEWFGDSPDYDEEDYASTADPGSDADPFSDAEDDPVPLASPTTSLAVSATATTTTPGPTGHGSPSCVCAGIQSCQFMSVRCSIPDGQVVPNGEVGGSDPPTTGYQATPRIA